MMVIAARFALYAILGLLVGTTLFSLYALSPSERERLPLLAPLTATLAWAGLGASCLGFWGSAAAMAGTGLGGVDHDTLSMLLGSTATGWAFLARSAALIVVGAAALLLKRWPTALAVTAALFGSVAVASLAWGGHAAASEGMAGWVHLGTDMLHLLAASAWLGALGMFLLLPFPASWGPAASREERTVVLHRTLASFARTGTLIVAVLFATGFANGTFIVGLSGLWALPASAYGKLLIAKLIAFAGMLGLAATNRFRLTPALAAPGREGAATPALARLRCSLALEIALLVLILALVAWLGTLDPTDL